MIAETSVGLSVALNVLMLELFGLTAGGMVVPGYLALYLDQPGRLLATFTVSIATLVFVRFFSSFVILYGKRRFSIMLLTGFTLNLLLSHFLPQGLMLNLGLLAGTDLRLIGYLVPGLLANEMANQGILVTISLTMILSILIRVLLLFFYGGAQLSGVA